MSAKSKIVTAAAIGALFVTMTDAASAQRQANGNNIRQLPRASERTYGHASRQVRRYNPASDAYYSDSLGHQSFPNPDRDFSIENPRSHPSE